MNDKMRLAIYDLWHKNDEYPLYSPSSCDCGGTYRGVPVCDSLHNSRCWNYVKHQAQLCGGILNDCYFCLEESVEGSGEEE